MRSIALVCLALTAGTGSVAAGDPAPHPAPADLVLRNGEIHSIDNAIPGASAVAISDGIIRFVGGDAGAAAWVGANTRVVDLHGRLVLPAFQDAHVHPLWAGLEYSQCPLLDFQTVQEYVDAAIVCDARLPPDQWLIGSGWSVSAFAPDGIPHKRLLDAVLPERPVILYSRDGHSIWTNSKAMEIAGVTAATPDPENGRIDRDPVTGDPVGSFQEAAATRMIFRHATPPTEAQLMDGLRIAIREMNSLGITAWQEADVPIAAEDTSRILPTYAALQKAEGINGHAVLALEWDNNRGLEQLEEVVEASRQATRGNVNARTVKFFLDGVIEYHTAALVDEYADRSGFRGEVQVRPEVLREAVAQLDAQGLQIHIHAIGDGAVRAALDAFEHARNVNGDLKNRHHIAHLQLVHPDDQPRFARLGVAANFQPLWAEDNDYMNLARPRLGAGRMQFIYPIGSLWRRGTLVAFGSDWSVSSVNPLEGIEVAVTRRAPDAVGGEGFLPAERITVEQAIRAYTLHAAIVNRLDDRTGSISPGKQADLIVLDRNILEIDAEQISETRVLLTLLAGRPVHGDLDGL
jgi:hypothetical protein